MSSSGHHGQVSRLPSRPRPVTKVRHGQPTSAVPDVGNPGPNKPRKPHGKKESSRATPPQLHEAPHRSRSQRQHDDLRSMGTWCDDIPERHYSPRMSIDVEYRRPYESPRVPTPPTPTLARLSAPHPSLLAFDGEFSEARPGDKDDRVGDAWYLARKAKTNRQLEEALAHIARTRLLPQEE
ncbi:hypothetical protein VUR80DRAFT_6213 [Thermomyces stellatus]